jgi:transcriptional regulator with XRE-family HTH domain
MTGRPTIKDVAEHAGVSIATVSRALNDKGDVSGETRERVREVARSIGYGLLRDDLTPRPAYIALKALLAG